VHSDFPKALYYSIIILWNRLRICGPSLPKRRYAAHTCTHTSNFLIQKLSRKTRAPHHWSATAITCHGIPYDPKDKLNYTIVWAPQFLKFSWEKTCNLRFFLHRLEYAARVSIVKCWVTWRYLRITALSPAYIFNCLCPRWTESTIQSVHTGHV
jgi:hypothetical protein